MKTQSYLGEYVRYGTQATYVIIYQELLHDVNHFYSVSQYEVRVAQHQQQHQKKRSKIYFNTNTVLHPARRQS